MQKARKYLRPHLRPIPLIHISFRGKCEEPAYKSFVAAYSLKLCGKMASNPDLWSKNGGMDV